MASNKGRDNYYTRTKSLTYRRKQNNQICMYSLGIHREDAKQKYISAHQEQWRDFSVLPKEKEIESGLST